MPKTTFDIAVVGAGAAGLTAAIAAARAKTPPVSIVLFDARSRLGAKILMSGGTRCNVTNQKVTPSDFEGGPKHIIKHVLEAFNPDETREFFEAIGVELILEPTGKYFPVTHSGKTVLDALIREAERLSVRIEKGIRITNVVPEDRAFVLTAGEKQFRARRVILTTGGLSYPETGSDGTGYGIARSLGHTLVPTTAALTPLTTDDPEWKKLSGVSLDVKLSFFEEGKKKAERGGSFLFTHVGFSGPAALDISRFYARSDASRNPEIRANFLPGHTEESLGRYFGECFRDHPRKMLKSFLNRGLHLPASFTETFLKKIEEDPESPMSACSKVRQRKIIHALLNYGLDVTGVVGYKKAEVTAGGVDLREVRYATLESRIVPGLFFSGEILDVDGRIGGFNFQWSWSSGTVAGRSAAMSLQE